MNKMLGRNNDPSQEQTAHHSTNSAATSSTLPLSSHSRTVNSDETAISRSLSRLVRSLSHISKDDNNREIELKTDLCMRILTRFEINSNVF